MTVPLVVLFAALLCAGLARTADAAHQRARAQSVADVVALAAASHGPAAAAAVSAANGASLQRAATGADGTVRVVVRVVAATARAAAATT